MTSGKATTIEGKEAQLAARVKSGATRAGESATPLYDVFERIKAAEARIKEARARKDEIANAKTAGELVDAHLAADWSRRLLSAVRLEADGLIAHIDLMGLPPEVATPLRAAAADMARRLRNRVAGIPELVAPPKPGTGGKV